MKNLAKLQAECTALGIKVATKDRASKEPYINALRDFHWRTDHPDELLPVQTTPMLLGSWVDLAADEAEKIENDNYAWAVQPKLDGIRVLVHIMTNGIRVTGRAISEVTYRLTEHQANVRHLTVGWDSLRETILDCELVCPTQTIDTGSCVTASPLQAAVAILATTAEKADEIQARQNARLELHAFDVLRCQRREVIALPLYERLAILQRLLEQADNRFVKLVPTCVVGKRSIHRQILNSGGEGSCWKRLDAAYFPGRRTRHWLKRKRRVAVEVLVSAAKSGTNGHSKQIGSVQFSAKEVGDSLRPIAWLSGWSDRERHAMTHLNAAGEVGLNPSYLGRRALIEGLDRSAKARRIRHARIIRWLD